MIVAGLLSAYPAFYMMLLFYMQFMSSIEFVFVCCFWVGFVSAVRFARNCAVSGFEKPRSYWLLALASVGVMGGLGEEALLLDSTKLPISWGFFEFATGSWLLVGLAACMLPNPSLNPDANKSRTG
jgi:hypothetical protein